MKFYHAIQQLDVFGSEIAPKLVKPYVQAHYAVNGMKITEISKKLFEIPTSDLNLEKFFFEDEDEFFQEMFDTVVEQKTAFKLISKHPEIESVEANWRKWIKCKKDFKEFLEVYSNFHGCLNTIGTKLMNEFMIFKNIRMVADQTTNVAPEEIDTGDDSIMAEEPYELDENGEAFNFDEKLINLEFANFQTRVTLTHLILNF